MTNLNTQIGKLSAVAKQISPDSKLLRSWGFDGGLSAQMTGFEVALSDGSTHKYILRQHRAEKLARFPDAALNEYRVLQALHAADVPVSEPIMYGGSGQMLPQPYVILRYIEGTPIYAPDDLDSYLRQAGRTLARIHQIDLSSLIQACLWPAPEVASPTAINAPVFLHGDFWPGNWLWRDGTLVAVIDWEDAALGDPLIDLAISRRDMAIIFGMDAVKIFTDVYRSAISIDDRNLPHWDLYAAELAAPHLAEWAAGYPALGRPDITEATMRSGLDAFILQARNPI